MLKTFNLVDGKLVACEAERAQLLVYVNPEDRERHHLTCNLGLDEHTLLSALDPEEVGRIEFEANHLAAIIKRPKKYASEDNFLFKVSSIGLFLFQDKLVLVYAGDDDMSWEGRIFNRMHSVRDIFMRIIFHCVLHFEEHLKVIRKISEEIEHELNEAVSNRDLLDMFKLSKSLVYYFDAISSNSKVIERLKMNSAKLAFDHDVNEFLDDLIIESSQCLQQADSYLDVLSGMTDAWAAVVSNNLNIRLKRLTVVSICIMTPTLVVSLFSMNVPLPIPQTGTILSFWIVTGLATFSVAVLLLIGYYKKL